MLHNNISNKESPRVAFDIDSLLFLPKQKGVIEKVLDNFRSDENVYLNRDINPYIKTVLNKVWTRYNVSVYLVTKMNLDKKQIQRLNNILWDCSIPYTRIEIISWEEIRYNIYNGYYMHVFSGDGEFLSFMSHRNAKHISDIWEVM